MLCHRSSTASAPQPLVRVSVPGAASHLPTLPHGAGLHQTATRPSRSPSPCNLQFHLSRCFSRTPRHCPPVTALSAPTPSTAVTDTAPSRNVLIASEDVQTTDACITWVLTSLATPREQLKVHLVHYVPTAKHQPFGLPLDLLMAPHQEPEPGSAQPEDAAKALLQREMQHHFGSRLQEAKVPYELHIVQDGTGSGKDAVGSAICKQADRLGCDVVVMASRSRGGLPELFKGSVANFVSHHCNRAVVVLHAPPAAAAGSGAPAGGANASHNILVAIDDSQESDVSCRWALHNLYSPGDTIHLMHVVPCLPPLADLPPFEGGSLLFGPALPFDLKEQEAEAWKRTQAERFKAIMDEAGAAHTFDITSECTQDPVTTISETLCQTAAQLQAKAVVCVARRNTELAELLFNSVTNYVAHHCDQPVVVLHA